jgi:hypothetical protein
MIGVLVGCQALCSANLALDGVLNFQRLACCLMPWRSVLPHSVQGCLCNTFSVGWFEAWSVRRNWQSLMIQITSDTRVLQRVMFAAL